MVNVWNESTNKCNYGKTGINAEINVFAWSFFQKFGPQIKEHLIYRAPFHGSLSKVLCFDSRIFVFIRFSWRHYLELLSFVTIFCFRTKMIGNKASKEKRLVSLKTFPHILLGDQFNGPLPNFTFITDSNKIPRSIWLINDQFHMSLIILISETVYKSVTKSMRICMSMLKAL